MITKSLNLNIMKFRPLYVFFSLVIISFFSSCEVVGDIFEAGVWSGILIVAAVVALIIFVVAKMMKK